MHAFAPRRTTEPQISGAITLGWRIAALYSLRAEELPSSPPDNLLPMRRSLPAAERLALELRAAAGDADRLGIGPEEAELRELLELAAQSPASHDSEARFHDRIRAWHIELQTMLWADHEATGKAYELGSFLADTPNRVVRELRGGEGARAAVTRELRRVFERSRVERIKRLLDDLQTRIDPAAVRVVKLHLNIWQEAVRERTPRHATRSGLEALDNQAVIWFQLVTGDKEPEAFIGHEERARVRETMVARMVRSYRRNWKALLLGAAAMAGLAAGAYGLVTADGATSDAALAALSPLAGALGVSLTSIGLTVRRSLDARAELLWNTALVAVICERTLRHATRRRRAQAGGAAADAAGDARAPPPLSRRCARSAAARRPRRVARLTGAAAGGRVRPVTRPALQGVRVLDLSRLLPGGFCSLLLADHGADVLKVEDTGTGDYIRWAPPYVAGAEQSARSALFLALNRNKRSIRIDLKQAEGREVLLALVREQDVVLESFRPGVLDRLGVGYDAMRAVNPKVVLCAITGYGQDGPLRDRPGHDMNYLALVGLLGLTGTAGGPPVQPAGQIADVGGGALMAAFGILAALREAERTGQGQVVDVSMADGALSWLALVAARYFADGEVPARGQLELAGGLACYRPYACAGGGWVALGALEPKFWQAWCRGVGREDLADAQFAAPGSALQAEVEAIFAARTRGEWEAFAADHECCLEPVLGVDEALASELVRAREMVVGLDQPGVGEPVRLLGAPVKLSRTPADCNRLPGPALGEHTETVLRAAGYDDARIARLLESGAVGGPPSAGSEGAFLA